MQHCHNSQLCRRNPIILPCKTSRRPSRPQRHGAWKVAVIVGKLSALFLFGVVYGITISHLHDTKELAAVKVGGVNRESWLYIASWGFAGVVLGGLLPYVDLVCHDEIEDGHTQSTDADKDSGTTLGEQWNEIIRSVGAFVGIAFAIVSSIYDSCFFAHTHTDHVSSAVSHGSHLYS